MNRISFLYRGYAFKGLLAVNIMVIHMYIAPGQGQTTLWASKYFHKHKSSVHLLIPSKFFAIK